DFVSVHHLRWRVLGLPLQHGLGRIAGQRSHAPDVIEHSHHSTPCPEAARRRTGGGTGLAMNERQPLAVSPPCVPLLSSRSSISMTGTPSSLAAGTICGALFICTTGAGSSPLGAAAGVRARARSANPRHAG